ncbi:hypothetical protein ACTJJ7_15600 [Phyllobacterium sp. 22229]|uniref:hypothetical protein n=1 Tax=Phyllobacterium sp. 22229 TaxID=3453895 RepID=UPI003F870B17
MSQIAFANSRDPSNSVEMSLQYHSAQAFKAIRMRDLIRRIGFVNNYPLWTEKEDEQITQHSGELTGSIVS